ncbi:MAG TPA: SseB family protein [Gemmataceae bacterium]|nr:SseB family protein [Gemmataceae bacterium]
MTLPTTLGPLVEELKAEGYRGPFANLCDGITAVVFHGPEVSLEPSWIEPSDNPFQMRVLNCKAFSLQSRLAAIGDGAGAIAARFQQARDNPRSCRQPPAIPDPVKIPCLLSYPRGGDRLPDGAHLVPEATEDLWTIFVVDDAMLFSRSWTGQLRYRARLLFRPGALFVTEVETSRTRPANDLDANLGDEQLPVRQVDFLIKALLYQVETPAPLPRGLSGREPGAIAFFSLTEYGRWGWFPTFEDTTEHRICLNGVVGRFRPPPNHDALLSALRAVEGKDDTVARQRLYDQLRSSNLYLSFVVPEEVRAAIQAGTATLSPETPIEIATHDWHGQQCCVAFSDPAYRITRGGGCMEFTAAGLSAHVLRQYGAGLVINPAGPGTCSLSREELEAISHPG